MDAVGLAPALALRQRGLGEPASARMYEFAGGLPPGATLSRASTGSRRDANGVLAEAAADVARFDHDPLSLAPRGLLIEPARTNLLARSSAIDHGSWIAFAAGVAANAAIAPDATAAADKIVEAAASGSHVRYLSAATVAGAVHSASAFFKRGERRYAHIAISGSGTTQWYAATIDLDAAAVTQSAAGAGGTLNGATAHPAGGGWVRAALTGAQPFGTSFLYLGIADAPSPAYGNFGLPVFAGDGASGLFAWGAMLEAGHGATSHIPTAGAAVTRAADVLTLDWAAKGLADGVHDIRYCFDDGSTQQVATMVSGGTAQVPVTLARRHLRAARPV